MTKKRRLETNISRWRVNAPTSSQGYSKIHLQTRND